jgi:hypothetical protein
VCTTVPNCRTDDGARAAYVDRLENFSSDWNHLNVQGQAEAAEIAWPAVAGLPQLCDPCSDDAVLSTSEYRGNPVGHADPGS